MRLALTSYDRGARREWGARRGHVALDRLPARAPAPPILGLFYPASPVPPSPPAPSRRQSTSSTPRRRFARRAKTKRRSERRLR